MEMLPPSPDMVKETLKELDERVEKLEQELKELRYRRQTWAAILSSLLSLGETDVESRPQFDMDNERLEATMDSLSRSMDDTVAVLEYGDFTKKMRRYLVGIQARLCHRSEIVRYAREMKTSSNFPYHFIKRMLENGELTEPMKGRYQATELMLTRAILSDPDAEVKG